MLSGTQVTPASQSTLSVGMHICVSYAPLLPRLPACLHATLLDFSICGRKPDGSHAPFMQQHGNAHATLRYCCTRHTSNLDWGAAN